MKPLTDYIKAHALKNALEHGKADPSKILPKLFQHGLQKSQIKDVIPTINKIIEEINSLSKEEQEQQFKDIQNLIPEKEEKIQEDVNWLTNHIISEIIIQSDRLPIYYKYFETLLELDKVYICTCKPKTFKKLINNKKSCPCRFLSKEEQKERWRFMFSKYKEGEAVARLKTDIQDKNPAMRDFPLFRINETKHPRTKKKFRVWPLMNMAVSIDDLDTKVTHVIRAKDHADNAKRKEVIHSYLGYETPNAMFVGRINFLGMPLSTTQTRIAIKKKKYKGWDDIRLPFLLAINHFNKEIIDKKANRYFFIKNPKKVKIKRFPIIELDFSSGISNTSFQKNLTQSGERCIKYAHPEQTIEIPLHPDDKNRGFRRINVKDEFYIEDKLEKNKNYRFMHLFNFCNKEFVSHDFDSSLNAKLIHWLPVSKGLVKVKVLMENNKYISGLAEPDTKKLKIGDIIQFERFGFVRLDKKSKSYLEFWWLHK